jgi:hypothetical protein
VTTALYGQEEITFAGKRNCIANIRSACRLNDECGGLVDPGVKYFARRVKTRVAGQQEITAQTIRKLLDCGLFYLDVRASSGDSIDAATYLSKSGELRGE